MQLKSHRLAFLSLGPHLQLQSRKFKNNSGGGAVAAAAGLRRATPWACVRAFVPLADSDWAL